MSRYLKKTNEKVNYYNCRNQRYIPFDYFKYNYKSEDKKKTMDEKKTERSNIDENKLKTGNNEEERVIKEVENAVNQSTPNNFWGNLVKTLIENNCIITIEEASTPCSGCTGLNADCDKKDEKVEEVERVEEAEKVEEVEEVERVEKAERVEGVEGVEEMEEGSSNEKDNLS